MAGLTETLKLLLTADDQASPKLRAVAQQNAALDKSFKAAGLSSAQSKGLISAWEKQVSSSGTTATGFSGKASAAFKKVATSASALPGPLGDIAAASEGAGIGFAAVATAGLGIAAIGGKLVGQFQGLALEVGNFADATGLSTQDASRFVEVAKDLNVPVDALQGSFGKLQKAVQNGSLAQIGVQAVRGKNGLVDMNATFLAVVQKLQSIPDEAARGAAAAKIFGKGWQSITPIITQPIEELKQRLAGVQDSKIINPDAVAQARLLRDTMDQLRDAVEGVGNTVGRFLLPAVESVVAPVAQIASEIDKLTTSLGGLGGGFAKVLGNLPGIGSLSGVAGALDTSASATDRLKSAATALLPPLKLLPGGFFDTKTAAEKQAEATAKAADENQRYSDAAAGLVDHQLQLAEAGVASTSSIEAQAGATNAAAAAADRLNQAQSALIDTERAALGLEIDQRDALRNVQDAADREAAAQQALTAATQKYGASSQQATQASRAAAAASDAVRSSVLHAGDVALSTAANNAKLAGSELSARDKALALASGMVQAAGSSATARNEAARLISQLAALKPQYRAQVIALVNEGNLPAAKALLDSMRSKSISVGVSVTPNGPTHWRVIPAAGGTGGQIGFFAQGGTIPGALGKAQLVIAHGGEVVLNQQQQSRLLFNLASGRGGVGGSSSGGGTIINYNIDVGAALDPVAAGRAVVNALKAYERRNGAIPIKVA